MSNSYPLSLRFSLTVLADRLAENVRILHVREVSTITDYFVLATATSTPHLRALSEELEMRRKQAGLRGVRKGGDAGSGWCVIDFGDVIVHVMTADLREFYALEQLWSDGKTVSPDEIELFQPATVSSV